MNLIVPLVALVPVIPSNTTESTDLHVSIAKNLGSLISGPDTKLQFTCLQLLRSVVQSTTPVLAFLYLQYLSSEVALIICDTKRTEDIQLVSEAIKILHLAYNLAPDSKKAEVFQVLLGVLITQLRPQNSTPLHTVVLQFIMQLASSFSVQFKESVNSLPDTEKNILETSIRQSFTTPSKPTTTQPTTAPKALTLDFSKYKS